jgi:hypothetical protein
MWSIFLAFSGTILGIWAIFKYLILIEMRLDANTYKTLYEVCKEERKFVIREEFVSESKPPLELLAFCSFKGAPYFYLNHSERLLTAGWQGKDSLTTVKCFRWSAKKLKRYFQSKLKELQLNKLGVPVELITPNYTDRIGVLKQSAQEPLQPMVLWQDIASEVEEVFSGQRDKTSALFYGAPGNGKTSFIRYLATKYRVPIKIITFDSQFTNQDLMSIFSQITPHCIVLFEDFDNYFDGRNCILGNGNTGIRFTFDIILNGLDGVYNTYENVVFFMTVNDISKVDYALKNRPSRFKYVREFCNPDLELRQKLIGTQWAEASEGLNLDQILRLKEFQAAKLSLGQALQKLGKEFKQEDIERVAHQRYLDRQSTGQIATEIEDWEWAKNYLATSGKVSEPNREIAV